MTDVWTVTKEQERFNYGECEILIEDVTSQKGNVYKKITFNIFPLAGTGNGNLSTASYFKFDNHTKPWDSHVLPAIRELVVSGKLKNASDINGKWVAWKWGQWRTYRKNDIDYWRNRANDEKNQGDDEAAKKSLAKIETDEKGREYIEKGYIHILDVFADEETCQFAYEARYGKIEKDDDIPTGLDENEATESGETDRERQSIAIFLTEYLFMSVRDGKVDVKLFEEEHFNSVDLLSERFMTIENHVIEDAIAKVNEGMSKEDLVPFIVEQMRLLF